MSVMGSTAKDYANGFLYLRNKYQEIYPDEDENWRFYNLWSYLMSIYHIDIMGSDEEEVKMKRWEEMNEEMEYGWMTEEHKKLLSAIENDPAIGVGVDHKGEKNFFNLKIKTSPWFQSLKKLFDAYLYIEDGISRKDGEIYNKAVKIFFNEARKQGLDYSSDILR